MTHTPKDKPKMAQQNKSKQGSAGSRRAELERELMNQDSSLLSQEKDTGRRQIEENPLRQSSKYNSRSYMIKQGIRRRHPHRVLHQFDGVRQGTDTAGSLWEQALMHENERTELPKEFQPKDDAQGMANQMGLLTTAMDNYRKSKNKLQRLFLVNV